MDGQVENILPPSASLGSLSLVLCIFTQVQASNDASLLYHKLFSLYVHIPHCCSSSSLSSYHCLPRVLVPSILPSKTVRDSLLNTLRDRSRCPDARATPSKRKTSFLSDSAYRHSRSRRVRFSTFGAFCYI